MIYSLAHVARNIRRTPEIRKDVRVGGIVGKGKGVRKTRQSKSCRVCAAAWVRELRAFRSWWP